MQQPPNTSNYGATGHVPNNPFAATTLAQEYVQPDPNSGAMPPTGGGTFFTDNQFNQDPSSSGYNNY